MKSNEEEKLSNLLDEDKLDEEHKNDILSQNREIDAIGSESNTDK